MIQILKVILVVVQVVSALLLIGLVLMQKSKSQGMGLAFGGAMGETLFGARAGNVLTRATVVLTIIFLLNTTLLTMLGSGSGSRSVVDRLPEQAQPMRMPQSPIQEIPADFDSMPPFGQSDAGGGD